MVKQRCSEVLLMYQTSMNALPLRPTTVTRLQRCARIKLERTHAVVKMASTVLLATALAQVDTQIHVLQQKYSDYAANEASSQKRSVIALFLAGLHDFTFHPY